jgi:hypothetical protein
LEGIKGVELREIPTPVAPSRTPQAVRQLFPYAKKRNSRRCRCDGVQSSLGICSVGLHFLFQKSAIREPASIFAIAGRHRCAGPDDWPLYGIGGVEKIPGDQFLANSKLREKRIWRTITT